MKPINENGLLKDALHQFFDTYHFANGGYHLKWFTIKVGFIHIPLPNTRARVEVARIHDIHHVLTGYPATLKGEAEIAGWEIASSCGNYPVAWFFNLGSFAYGLFFFPKAVFKAFMRGRSVHTNFYHTPFVYDELLQQEVNAVRRFITKPHPRPVQPADYAIFMLYCLLVFAVMALMGYAVYLCLAYVLPLATH